MPRAQSAIIGKRVVKQTKTPDYIQDCRIVAKKIVLEQKDQLSELGPGSYESGLSHMSKTYSAFFPWQKSERIQIDDSVMENLEERNE
jgi:hypothetical protein